MAFNSENGESYQLQRSTDLVNWGTWETFDGTGQQLLFTDPSSLFSPRAFYRVQYQQ